MTDPPRRAEAASHNAIEAQRIAKIAAHTKLSKEERSRRLVVRRQHLNRRRSHVEQPPNVPVMSNAGFNAPATVPTDDRDPVVNEIDSFLLNQS